MAALCQREREEAVFSSSEDRTRASQASIAVAGPRIVSQNTRFAAAWAVPASATAAWATRAAESLFSVLFPSDCRICGEPLLNVSRLPVCMVCLAQLHPVRGKVCSICGERVLSSYAESDADGLRICPVCRRLERPFGRAVAYGSYDGGLRELVHLLKFNGVRPAAGVLGRMLAEAITVLEPAFEPLRMFDRPIAVIPVPLHKAKLRQRGFNQAELIAKAALKALPSSASFELVPAVLQRTRDTGSQIGLTSHQRRENLRGAFAVRCATEITGREVILVDDVYTTGTTASECARVLRRAGASQVWVATVARTLKLASKYLDIAEEAGAEELAGTVAQAVS